MKTKGTCGIYTITDTVCGNVYVGQSRFIERRFSVHKNELNNNKHHNFRLQKAWNSYGKDRFKFEIVEVTTEDMLTEREGYYINKFRNGLYNIAFYPEPTKGTKRTEAQKKVLSRKATERYKDQLERDKVSFGLKRYYEENPEAKEMLATITKKQLQKPTRKSSNDKHLQNLAIVARRPIICLTTMVEYDSVLSAAKILNVDMSGILGVLSKSHKHCNGLVFHDAMGPYPKDVLDMARQDKESLISFANSTKGNGSRKIHSDIRAEIDGEDALTLWEFCEKYLCCSVTNYRRRVRGGMSPIQTQVIDSVIRISASAAHEWLDKNLEQYKQKSHKGRAV